jgi:hypothetical protein
MLGALGMVAIESRTIARTADLAALARHASWIAGNALAACGLWVTAIDAGAAGRALWLGDADAPRLLAVLAAVPALPIAASLPWSARTVLRVLGVPTIAPADGLRAIDAGARVVVGERAMAPVTALPARAIEIETGYRVSFAVGA